MKDLELLSNSTQCLVGYALKYQRQQGVEPGVAAIVDLLHHARNNVTIKIISSVYIYLIEQ